LIAVMLMLLIIFMIAAPLSTVELPVDLPTSTAVPQKKTRQADLRHHQI
jgi:biopolymer transport protein ExbD